MKSSTTNKVVIVKINDKRSQVTVDADIHDDIFVEAATRVVEKNRKNMSFFHRIKIIGECYEKSDEQNIQKHYQINMYHILMNAGLYTLAELLREKTKNHHKVDLLFKPVIEHVRIAS